MVIAREYETVRSDPGRPDLTDGPTPPVYTLADSGLSSFTVSASEVRIAPMMFMVGHMAVPIDAVDGGYVASEPRTGMYGEGPTPELALKDLLESLSDLRDLLRDSEGRLAPELAASLEFLDAVLWA